MYKNSFYNRRNPYSQEWITPRGDEQPIEYKRHFIHRRLDEGYWVFDVVKNNVCIGMYNGLNGAKNFIDNQEKNT
jgi:hypothetical protein